MSEIEARSFQARFSAAIATLFEPPTNALRPSRARSEGPLLTLAGKAQIVMAHLNKRPDWPRVAARLLIEAMTLECYAAAFCTLQKRDLNRFLDTRIGTVATRLASLKEHKTRIDGRGVERQTVERWEPTYAVKQTVGSRIRAGLREILPRWWVSDDVVTQTIQAA